MWGRCMWGRCMCGRRTGHAGVRCCARLTRLAWPSLLAPPPLQAPLWMLRKSTAKISASRFIAGAVANLPCPDPDSLEPAFLQLALDRSIADPTLPPPAAGEGKRALPRAPPPPLRGAVAEVPDALHPLFGPRPGGVPSALLQRLLRDALERLPASTSLAIPTTLSHDQLEAQEHLPLAVSPDVDFGTGEWAGALATRGSGHCATRVDAWHGCVAAFADTASCSLAIPAPALQCRSAAWVQSSWWRQRPVQPRACHAWAANQVPQQLPTLAACWTC